MTSPLQVVVLSTILCSSAALVDFQYSRLLDEQDLAVPAFNFYYCSSGCQLYASVPEASAEIAKNIMIHDYVHDEKSLYDISRMTQVDGQKSYFEIISSDAPIDIINNNPGSVTAPLAVWIVKNNAPNYGSKVFEKVNWNTVPAPSTDVVTIMSVEPFTVRVQVQGGMRLVGTLTGFDDVSSAADASATDDCIYVIDEEDSDKFQDVQAVVQSPLFTLYFDWYDFQKSTVTLTAAAGSADTLDFSGVSFVASPGFIGCKNSQTFRSRLYEPYTSIEYSKWDKLYDVSISSVLHIDADHPVTIADKTNEKKYKLSPWENPTGDLNLLQTNNLVISCNLTGASDNSFLVRLTPSNERASNLTTTVIPPTTIRPESPPGACPSPLILYRDGQCRGYYTTAEEYMDDSAGQVISSCNKINAQPVSIHTQEQQDYWRAQKTDNYFILGLTCNSKSKKWEWADGTTLDYKPPTYGKELDTDCKSGCNWYLESDGAWHNNCTHTSQMTDFFCISQIPQPAPSMDCVNFDDSDESECFEVIDTAETWNEARSICHNFGAELASVHSQQQNSYIRRLAVSRGAVNGVLLGGTTAGKGSNEFGWVDGTPWDYTNFHAGFPIAGLGECLSMDTITTSGQWMNTDCDEKMPVVCSRQLDTSEPVCPDGPWTEGQVIYSPGFPTDASVPCEYFLTVAEGKRVQLQILLLEANSCCDFLIITEGYIGGAVLANLTGDVRGATYTTSDSNIMRVLWQPNGGVNVRGVMMSFTTY